MHEESSAVMRCLSQEVMDKSCKKQQGKLNIKKSLKDKQNNEEEKRERKPENVAIDVRTNNAPAIGNCKPLDYRHVLCLAEANEEQLIVELARRRAEKYRFHGDLTTKKGFISNPSETKALSS